MTIATAVTEIERVTAEVKASCEATCLGQSEGEGCPHAGLLAALRSLAKVDLPADARKDALELVARTDPERRGECLLCRVNHNVMTDQWVHAPDCLWVRLVADLQALEEQLALWDPEDDAAREAEDDGMLAQMKFEDAAYEEEQKRKGVEP